MALRTSLAINGLLVVLSLSCFCCLAPAAEENAQTTRLETITVSDSPDEGYAPADAYTATKMDVPIKDIPQSIEVRTRQMLDDLGGTQTSYEVSRTVAGAFSAENGQGDPGRNVPNFFFRGFSNNGSYLKDGHLINGWMSTVDMANVDRVEFLKGPASVLYGGSIYTGDIGGVVNYVSKMPSAGQVASVGLTGGSYDFYRGTADFGGPLNGDRSVTYRLNGALERSGSFRDFARHHSEFVAPAMTWNLSSRDSLTLLTEAVHSHEIPARGLPLSEDSLGVSPKNNYIDPGYTETDIDGHNLAARYEHEFNERWQAALDVTQTGSYTDQFSDYLTYNAGDVSTLDGSRWKLYNDQVDVDARITGKIDTGPLHQTLLAGYNVLRNHYKADSRFGWNTLSIDLTGDTLSQIQLPPSGSTSALYASTPADPGKFHWDNDEEGVYAQDLIGLGRHFKALVGARYDRYKNDTTFSGSFGESNDTTRKSHTSPRFGLIFEPWTTTSIYAVTAEAFSPNSGVTLKGSAPPPELGKLKEIGLKQAVNERLDVNLAYYDLARQNMAFTDPADPNGIAVLIAGETRSRGYELDINGRVTEALRINVAASVLRAWVNKGEPGGSLAVGNEIAGVPRKTLNIWGVYSFGENRSWEAGGGFYYARKTWADDANTFRVPNIMQWDAMVARRLGTHARLQVNLKNLTNRDNYTSNGWGWVNPGEPRSIYANLNYDF